MSLSGFAAGFAAGWKMVDDFMGDLEERKEKNKDKEGLATSVAQAGQEFAGNLNSAANAPDGTTPETAIPQEGLPPERIEQDDAAEGSWLSGRQASGEQPSVEEMELHIRASARARGIDPDVAVRVARSEGLARGVWQSNVVDPKRGREPSYGPLQLLVGGSNGWPRGVGNDMIDRTGLDPSDPKNWREAIDFGLDTAARDGWRQWYGAEKVGIGRWDGVRRGAAQTQPAVPDSAVPGPRAAIDVFEDALEPLEPLQPTFMVNAGGAIPDDQGRTTFSAQAPNAQGSVFLQHETQRPQGQQQARRIEFPQQQARQAIPTGPSTADRFREMRAGHAQRRADAEAARAAAAAQQPVQNKATYTDDEWDSRMWMYEQQRQGGGRQMQSGGDYGAPNQLQSLMQIHRDVGGLRSDPTGAYIVKPPQRNGWLIQSGPEWEAYKELPKAPQEMVTRAFDGWRFNTTGATSYGDPGGGVANAATGGDPSLGHGTSTDW